MLITDYQTKCVAVHLTLVVRLAPFGDWRVRVFHQRIRALILNRTDVGLVHIGCA